MAAVADRGTELFNAGRYEQALAAFRESAGRHRQQAVGDPNQFEPVLAVELHNIGLCLAKLHRYPHAVAAFAEAAQICDRYWRQDQSLGALYAAVSGSLAGLLVELGAIREAMDITFRAVVLRRALTVPGAPAVDPTLAEALRQYAYVRALAGRELEQAAEAATEALTIYEHLVQAAPEQFGIELDAALEVAAAVVDARTRHDAANGTH